MEILTDNRNADPPLRLSYVLKWREDLRETRKLIGVQCYGKIEKNNVPYHNVCLELSLFSVDKIPRGG